MLSRSTVPGKAREPGCCDSRPHRGFRDLRPAVRIPDFTMLAPELLVEFEADAILAGLP